MSAQWGSGGRARRLVVSADTLLMAQERHERARKARKRATADKQESRPQHEHFKPGTNGVRRASEVTDTIRGKHSEAIFKSTERGDYSEASFESAVRSFRRSVHGHIIEVFTGTIGRYNGSDEERLSWAFRGEEASGKSNGRGGWGSSFNFIEADQGTSARSPLREGEVNKNFLK